MKIVKASKVYVCCAQYVAVESKYIGEPIYCPRCKKKLTAPVKTPIINITV